MYEVIKHFTDLQDNNYIYHAGDTYPRKGIDVSEKRLAELSGSNNRRHIPLIKKVAEESTDSVKEEKPKSKRTKTKG